MGDVLPRVLHQSFLPAGREARALVFKYTPVYWGRRPRHFHSEPELNLLVSGSAVFGIGERVVQASAGDLLGFAPGQDHVLLEASPDLYLYAIGIEAGFSAEVLRGEHDSVALPLHVRLAPGDFSALAARAANIVDRKDVDQAGAELWEQAYWLRRRQLGQARRTMHVLTRRALAAISDAPGLDLASLAQSLRVNASEVSRHFHRDLAMTLVQYRTRLRLLRFLSLVDAGTDNLLASAVNAGFGSYSQCHRIFQAELGCGPRHFLSEQRQRMQLAYDP